MRTHHFRCFAWCWVSSSVRSMIFFGRSFDLEPWSPFPWSVGVILGMINEHCTLTQSIEKPACHIWSCRIPLLSPHKKILSSHLNSLVGPGFILSVAGHTGGKRAISSWPVSGTGYERVGILGCLLSGLDVNNINLHQLGTHTTQQAWKRRSSNTTHGPRRLWICLEIGIDQWSGWNAVRLRLQQLRGLKFDGIMRSEAKMRTFKWHGVIMQW
jgi:hypothetical protein